ncbi:MAG: ATP-binding protein [Oscillospiraceae bacterium]
MQSILTQMRKAILHYNMIKDGDKILVAISGGKDSVCLLVGLSMLKRYIGIDYTLLAVTLDPTFGGVETDYTLIQELCNKLEIPYIIKRTQIGNVVFDIRQEPNPCSLCARMRRGILHDIANENNCNVIALGHHNDDAVQTFIMNLFNEGRIGCFSPVTYLSRKNLTSIRPLVFIAEKDIIRSVRRHELPIVKSKCSVDGHTQREWTKDFLKEMDKKHININKKLFGAMVRGKINGW